MSRVLHSDHGEAKSKLCIISSASISELLCTFTTQYLAGIEVRCLEQTLQSSANRNFHGDGNVLYLYIYYGSQRLQVAARHLKCGQRDQETDFLIKKYLYISSYIQNMPGDSPRGNGNKKRKHLISSTGSQVAGETHQQHQSAASYGRACDHDNNDDEDDIAETPEKKHHRDMTKKCGGLSEGLDRHAFTIEQAILSVHEIKEGFV
ncbi:PREDICTED: uncharacterized protein LOC106148749 [Chinchilla lanigera]|uniref:uncharacterized protein LOC106148749 n=1 Tax=Chinchilla lanigera TaxID=34839 RepID=UPI000698B2F7|nr:PREDICTED: uncharacterized protein LOC106148749 [Chinchilla lanigera]